MESLDITRREEDLGKKLVDLYGLTVANGIFPFNCNIKIAPNEARNNYALFSNWHSVLFGDDFTGSLNDVVINTLNQFCKRKVNVVDYSSLDELDIQLTLAGANK